MWLLFFQDSFFKDLNIGIIDVLDFNSLKGFCQTQSNTLQPIKFSIWLKNMTDSSVCFPNPQLH